MYLGIDNISLKDCIAKAEQTIDSGKALDKLNEFVEATNSFEEVITA